MIGYLATAARIITMVYLYGIGAGILIIIFKHIMRALA